MAELTVEGIEPIWTLGDRLRKARETSGMSQTELAVRIDVSRRSISKYETGEAMPRRHQLIAWAMATGVALEWLLPRLDSNQQPSDYRLAA